MSTENARNVWLAESICNKLNEFGFLCGTEVKPSDKDYIDPVAVVKKELENWFITEVRFPGITK